MSISMTDAVMATYPGPNVALATTAATASQAAAGASTTDDDTAKRAAIDKTAKSFEASFLSTMIGQMFEGVETAKPFGGGEGESAFRSFLTEAMGKSMTRHGGIGLSKAISQEMLKMQGLS